MLCLYEIIKRNIIEISHPVGSVYISTNDVNPTVLFGGVWQRVSGACLYCCDDDEEPATYGGSKKITVDNLPPHTHTIHNRGFYNTGGSGKNAVARSAIESDPDELRWTTDSTGGGTDYIPYHFKVVVWQRIG